MIIMIIVAYLVIGLLYGAATCLKVWTEWSSANDMQKLQARIRGLDFDHWLDYVILMVSRTLGWPVYILINFVA